jgi:hypothetical protein
MRDFNTNKIEKFVKNLRNSNKNLVNEYNVKSPSMRDLLKITRNLNERENKETIFDQKNEEEKLRDFFKDMNINFNFINLKVFDDLVFWGGTVDGVIQFIYKVTPNEQTSGVEFNYLKDFSPDNPENDEIINRLEEYYNTFYSFWNKNVIVGED